MDIREIPTIIRPTWSTLWIGAPPDSKTAPGHDVFGVIEMAKGDSQVKILFFCLGPYADHYRNSFKDYRNIEVKSIQKFLNSFSVSSPAGKHAKNIQYMIEILLSEKRNTTKDKVCIKVALSIFLLYTIGGYVGDTNIRPIADKKISLPPLDHFYMPKICEGSLEKMDDLEVWLMYSPSTFNETAAKIFDRYSKLFLKREKIYAAEGYSKKYYGVAIDLLLIPAFHLVKKGEIRLWPTVVSASRAYVYLYQFNLVKNYYNTHKIEYSGFYDKNSKNLPGSISPAEVHDQLFYAIEEDDTSKMLDLIARGMDINRQVKTSEVSGETPLHSAIMLNRLNAIHILLENNPNLELKANYGEWNNKEMTPYQLALHLQNQDIIHIFEEHAKKEEHEKKTDQSKMKAEKKSKNDLRFFDKSSIEFSEMIMKPAYIVGNIYKFSELHKKKFPEDKENLDLFKKQVLTEYQSIEACSSNSLKQQNEFLLKYGNPNINEMFEDFLGHAVVTKRLS